MKLAAAQTQPKDSIAANLRDHERFIDLAAEQGVQLIVFPELSISGYQRGQAADMAFSPNDGRLRTLKEQAIKCNMIVVAGAPISLNAELYIGAFVLLPDGNTAIYTKQFLHDGEEQFFSSGYAHDPLLTLGGETISLAICADISHAEHAANAAAKNTTLYVAGIFYTPNGMSEGIEQLSRYSRHHCMNVLMSNYGGPCWGLDSGGGSAFWNSDGICVGSLGQSGEGLLIAEKKDHGWTSTIITM